MNLKAIGLYVIKMPLKLPFSTHLGTVAEREAIIVEAVDTNGLKGYGEAVAFSSPWYTEETVQTCYHVLKDFLIPLLKDSEISHPNQVDFLFHGIRRNHMAKAALEMAIWDLYAKQKNTPLARILGSTATSIPAGVVVGAKTSSSAIDQIEGYIGEGYSRIKVKISPDNDYALLAIIRERFPDIQLMADANSAYTLDDIEKLKALDEFGLLMIEQPLAVDDIVDHAKLQKQLKTPICLDESIVSFDDARKAIELGSCQVINIKIGRVGGLNTALAIHDFCKDSGVPVWCGGMLEFGVSRAHNIALAGLPGFTIPGDISSSSRYWEEDIIMPEVTVRHGAIEVPDQPGIGFEINCKRLRETCSFEETFRL
ncbi:o-succinylbenzoate synthase [Bacillus sp. V33-4]|uniref:o-succinylbenzoate synthase n=1 Tax=Bacillus sp. V33-4 TaxID=2054169 RepID=UPI000C77096A|nr:o-succinylbenzoate synthase [Bacillus sp. V33-4]PLR86966.1 o-succinylbenzoate synthase [Bacillus sp. V33-4]